MAKLKDGIKMFGSGIFGIVLFVLYIAVSLAIMYFSIRFVLDMGDKIFHKDSKPESSEQQKLVDISKGNAQLREQFVTDCAKQGNDKVLCSCSYNGMWTEYSKDDMKQIILTQKYTPNQQDIFRKVSVNCGVDKSYYK